MSWYASDNIEKAYESTRDFLLPFDSGTWLRMALVVLLTGGFSFSGLGNVGSLVPSGPSPSTAMHTTGASSMAAGGITGALTGMSSTDAAVPAALIGIGTVVLLLGLVFLFISSVFEFVFYHSIREKEVRIVDYFSTFLHQGLQYSLFRVVYFAALLSVIALIAVLFLASLVIGSLSVLVGIALLLGLAVLGGLVHDFVVPEMLESGDSLIQSSRRVWPEVKEEWREVGGYLLLRLAVNIAAGIGSGFLVLLAAFLYAILFGIPVILLFQAVPPVAVLLVLVGVLAWMVTALLIRVPFSTYLYYYYLHMYEDLVG